MNPFSLGEAAAACGGAYTGDAALRAAPVQDVCIDSRRATPGGQDKIPAVPRSALR